ncbi:hypothetical protein [Bhargavaea ginsengi]|uniref:hypothetical protein n=1 Tax=Bhargavaea ginsengi TaxID=426757 RepID=UPI003C766FC7
MKSLSINEQRKLYKDYCKEVDQNLHYRIKSHFDRHSTISQEDEEKMRKAAEIKKSVFKSSLEESV